MLSIGTKLYRDSSPHGVFEYTIFELHVCDRALVRYAIRCENCSHGDKCEVIVNHCPSGEIVYHSMANQDCEDQYYWHSGEARYRLTKKEALEDAYNRAIETREEEIKECKDRLRLLENRLEELVTARNSL